MSYETKVLIVSMAEFARATKNKPMYDYVKALAQSENVKLTPYNHEEKVEPK